MGLQLRLRHALGERLFDLPDRPVENPLIFGRAREAEVKIPSVTVASHHCALFVHENQWVLQDTSGGSTWVNGNAIEGPTPLCVGDVITLGSDATPATIEVDPAGVTEGRTGYPVEASEVAEVPPEIAPSPSYQSSPSRPAPARPAAGGGYYAAAHPAPPRMPRSAPAPVAADDGWGSGAASGEESIAGWGEASPASGTESTTPRRRKPQKQVSNTGLMIGIGAGVAIVAVVLFVAFGMNHEPPKPAPVVKAPSGPVDRSDNIFGIGTNGSNGHSIDHSSNDSTPSPTPTPRATTPDSSDNTPAPTPAPTSDANPTPTSADPDDKGWEDVQAGTISPDIGQAILKFDDYRRQHPSAHTAQLDQFTEDAMDRLWWKRISALCVKRDDANKRIKAKEKDIKEEPSVAFKKTLGDEKKAIEAELALTQEKLASQMGYTAEGTPDLDNKDEMAKLMDARDAGKYGAWKVSTLKFIRLHHGSTPWDGE